MQNDPESDFEDAADFFRRGDDGDYAEAESVPAASIAFAENDQSAQTDPKLLERQLARRARYTRRVKLGMTALSVVTVGALFTHALHRSPGDSRNTDASHSVISEASPPRHATLAPANGLEAPTLGPSRAAPSAPDLRAQMPSAPPIGSLAVSLRSAITEPAVKSEPGPSALASPPAPASQITGTIARSSAVTGAAARRAAKVATAGARGAGRQALASNMVAKPLTRSSLPSLATSQASTNQAASRPPTARFAD